MRETYAAWATRQRQACSRREKQAQATGVAASSSWPTPTASDGGYFPDLLIEQGRVKLTAPHDVAVDSGGQYPLSQSTKVWTSLWLTMKGLGWAPAQAISPSSLPVRVSFKHGTESFTTTLTSNPRFYELVMGWPIGWTAPGEPVTGYAAWLQRSRGLFSRLLTIWTPADL